MKSIRFMRRMLVSMAMLTYVTLLPAQQPDIRLSPEPMSSQLPADIQIQSAATIGSRTLVVWGSGALNEDGSFRPILRMQMLEGSEVYGEQRTIHSEEARPYGVVKVVPAGNRFVVLWNDRRDTSVVVGMSIDVEGNEVSAESTFYSGTVRSADDIQLLPFDDGSSMVVANVDQRGRRVLAYRRIPGDAGEFGAETEITGGPFVQLLMYDELPGLVILRRDTAGAVVIHPEGYIDERRIPAGRLRGAFYLDSDSSLVVADDQTLTRYSYMSDTVPDRVEPIEMPSGYLPESLMLGTDSLGRAQLIYVVWLADFLEWIHFRIERRTLLTAGNYVGPDSLAGEYFWLGNNLYITPSLVQRTVDCNNRFTIQFSVSSTTQYPGIPPTTRKYPYVFEYYRNDIGISESGSAEYGCQPIRSRDVARTSSIVGSDITVSINDSPILLSHTFPDHRLNLRQERPVVMLRQDNLLTAWQVDGQSDVVSKWEGIGTADQKGVENTGTITHLNGYRYSWEASEAARSSSAALHTRRSFVSDNPIFLLTFTQTSTITLSFPSADGWSAIFFRADSESHTVGPPKPVQSDSWFRLRSLTFDPDNNQSVAAISNWRTNQAWLIGISESGGIAWIDSSATGLRSVVESSSLLPSGDHSALLIGKGLMRSVADGTVIDSVPFISPKSSRLAPLLGDNFLRYYPDSTDSRHYAFDIMSPSGAIVHHADFSLAVDPLDMTITQRPGDSSLFLVYGSNHGVYATVLSSDLRLLRQDRQISEGSDSTRNPSAIINGELLIVAWEDYRNGVADIYGTWTHAERVLSAPEVETGATDLAVVVVPNPATDRLVIELNGDRQNGVTFELHDGMGRMIASESIQPELRRHVFDVTGIASGVYTLTVRAGERRVQRQVVVLH